MQDDAPRRAEEAIAKQWKRHHRIEAAPGVWDTRTWTVEESTVMGRPE